MVTWDPDWQVVLEAGWGLFMTVLVAASLLTVVVPSAAATSTQPAATWEVGRRYLTTCVAVGSAYLALVALTHPVTPAAIARTWSALAMAWAFALLVTGWTARSRTAVEAADSA